MGTPNAAGGGFHLTTCSDPTPPASSAVRRFLRTCSVWVAMSPSGRLVKPATYGWIQTGTDSKNANASRLRFRA